MPSVSDVFQELQNEQNEIQLMSENETIIVDAEQRTIVIPESESLFGVKFDKDVERKYFQCPKIVGDNIDLSQCQIYIAYVAMTTQNQQYPETGVGLYNCDDVEISGDNITFSWKLSGNVFAQEGYIAFKVVAKQSISGELSTRWNTVPAFGTILNTISDGEDIAEQYSDIINQLLTKMENVEKIATPEAMQSYVNSYLEENPPSSVEIDETLTKEGKAADSKVTGNELAKRIIAPTEDGTEGQVLSKDANGNNIWKNNNASIEDGTITLQKLSQDLSDDLNLERHVYTEIEIEVKRADYNSFYNGTESNGSGTSTGLFKTPQKIRIENNHSHDIEYVIARFSDSDDYENANFIIATSRREANYLKTGIPSGESVVIDTDEYGIGSVSYMQLRVHPIAQWNQLWNNIKIYALYDSWKPTYKKPEQDGIFDEDLYTRWTFQGLKAELNRQGLIAVVPYYPDFTYNIRGGGYVNALANTLDVIYLLDDEIFNGYHNSIVENSSVSGSTYVKRILAEKTVQYDTSVNAGANSDYAWSYHKTPPESELVGPKWVAICSMYIINKPASTDLGQEYYNEQIQILNDLGPQLMYVTKFDDKNAPRRLLSTYVKQIINQNDGTYYNSLLKQSGNPLAGSRWVLFGDSLTDSYGGHDLTGSYFASKIAREFGMELDNRAKSGSNINTALNGNYTNVNGCVMLDTLISEVEVGTTIAPDYITVAFGTNGYTAQNGTVDDTSENKETTCGAVKYFIEKCTEKFPNAFLGFVLPPLGSWKSEDGQEFPNANKDVDAARAAIKSVLDLPEYGGIPYIDMSKKSGITLDMLPDKIHISTDQTNAKYYRALRGFLISAGV